MCIFHVYIGPCTLVFLMTSASQPQSVTSVRDAGSVDACGELCTHCVKEPHPFWDVVGRGKEMYRCMGCTDGSAMFDGPPKDNLDENVGFRNHCVRMVGKESKVLMIRHGESIWNSAVHGNKFLHVTGRQAKWTDSPLSPMGLRQAQRLALVLHKADEFLNANVLPTEILDPPASRGRSIGTLEEEDQRQRVFTEAQYTDLEKLLQIRDKSHDPSILLSDAAAVSQLLTHPEELEVLLGKRCNETAYVSSQLVRAMDTFLIATMPSRARCGAPWFISSNMQELEHNADCTARTAAGTRPSMTTESEQFLGYAGNQMLDTAEYVEKWYGRSDISRYTENRDPYDRTRAKDQSSVMVDEAKAIISSGKKYTLMGGHSIWFRIFFQLFGDVSDPTCVKLAEVKMANTGIISAIFREAADAPHGFAATDCKFIYLDDSDLYSFKLDSSVQTSHPPANTDFAGGVSTIMGWMCCCSRNEIEGSFNEAISADSGVRKYADLSYYGGCLVVETETCPDVRSWGGVVDPVFAANASAAQYAWRENFDLAGGCPGAKDWNLEVAAKQFRVG